MTKKIVAVSRHIPKLLGHERHERVQHRIDFTQHMRCTGLGRGLCRLIVTIESRFQKFEIPVAKRVPRRICRVHQQHR